MTPNCSNGSQLCRCRTTPTSLAIWVIFLFNLNPVNALLNWCLWIYQGNRSLCQPNVNKKPRNVLICINSTLWHRKWYHWIEHIPICAINREWHFAFCRYTEEYSKSIFSVKSCAKIQYPKKLPQTSVIIIFYNEELTILLRTIWSAITKSPRALLKEVILLDDGSTNEDLGQKLNDYLKNFSVPVVLVRAGERIGLIRAKLLAVQHAKVSSSASPPFYVLNFWRFKNPGTGFDFLGCTCRM